MAQIDLVFNGEQKELKGVRDWVSKTGRRCWMVRRKLSFGGMTVMAHLRVVELDQSAKGGRPRLYPKTKRDNVAEETFQEELLKRQAEFERRKNTVMP